MDQCTRALPEPSTVNRRAICSSIVLRSGLGRRIEFSRTALEVLAGMGKLERRFVLGGIQTHLNDNDPSELARNKFLLRRPSAHAERELRLENWRVFYTVLENGPLVVVNLIGEKRGNRLFIGRKEFES